MLEPQQPHNEKSRLNSLRAHDVLDTPPSPQFDRLTRMAQRLFDVPIALVSLVDENRQWFKSCIGLPLLETPRNISFCGHAILGDDIFLIPDASMDIRFADNPLVTGEPDIRFYAGCPLRGVDGSKLGTLCIIDTRPRNLSLEDMDTLRDLAGMVESELAALHLATMDELTGIPNRRGLLMLAQNSLNICQREEIPATLAYCDLNSFKPINDRFGHAEGDRALKTFANGLKTSFRKLDVVGRVGGDEFVILLINTNKEHADRLLENLRDAMALHAPGSNADYSICFSTGIAEFEPKRHSGIEDLLSEADSHMYSKKKFGSKGGSAQVQAGRRAQA